ncbi:MAG: NAD(P)H-dependent glycerol-3-phosphate dehydrogenase [Rudaea sp.]
MAIATILGAGVMGTALTFPLADNGHEVRLVGTHLDREIIDRIRSTGVHPGLNSRLPGSVRPYQVEDAAGAFDGAEVVVSGVNSFGVHWAGQKMADLLQPGMLVLAVTKGMEAKENGDLRILPDVLADGVAESLRPHISWNAITGPSIAGELAARRPTCVVFAGRNGDDLSRLAEVFRTSYYHVWISTDLEGAELCAAMKNGYAIGVGYAEGLRERQEPGPDRMHNYEAAIFTEAALEMEQLVAVLGGRRESVYGLPGIGDLYVTSAGGRNLRLGRLLGSGLTFEQAREVMAGMTLEGAEAIRVVGAALPALEGRGKLELARFPLLRYLYEIITEGKAPPVPWEEFFNRNVRWTGQ